MKYLKKSIIIIPIIILLLLFGIISIFKYKVLGFVLFLVSIAFMIYSFIYALASKKWLKGILYFILYPFFLLITFVILVFSEFSDLSNGQIDGSTEYYNEKLNYHLETDDYFELTILCKDDKIYESFTGDSRSACIFKLRDNEYNDLILKIKNNKDFEKINIESLNNHIDLNKLECSQTIIFDKTGYESYNTNGIYSRIVFSKDNKYLLFNLDYY
ncbi:MAG: hypothetical protein LAT51_09030 [Flavobacteriaceae bacterium]|nr:hypothetical protein [Flavobacteriaceae bacterium]